jgi:hypothetical protein
MPDGRWVILGFQDFTTYCKATLVEGLFNPIVPKDVNEAFLMAEYMMAHSYYHYPLYHEAFSKVLRIFEMAIKLRCRQLNIDLEHTKKGGPAKIKKTLKMLMDDLIKAEPAKELNKQFEVARSLRNSTMHPDRHLYSGVMTKNYIKQAVILLNSIFVPESQFKLISGQLRIIKAALNRFQDGLFVLMYNGKKYLIEKADVEAGICVNEEWEYLLVGYPVMLNIKPLTFAVSNLNVSNQDIKAIEVCSGETILIEIATELANLNLYAEYKKELNRVNERERAMYKHNTSNEVEQSETDFLYKRFWKMKV